MGRYPVKIQSVAADALKAFNRSMEQTGYENPCDYIGSYLNRTIGNKGKMWSTHSYGTAIDFDYGGDNPDSPDHALVDNNPHLHRRITDADYGVNFQLLKHQVDAIKNIRNTIGQPVFLWLGDGLGDTMHFQINVRPEHLEIDWTTVGGEGMCPWINRSDKDKEWWTSYPPCDNHYSDPAWPAIAWNSNTGVCNVPSWGEASISQAVEDGILKLADRHRDDYDAPMTYGTHIVLNYR
jgi:hypothetical protein